MNCHERQGTINLNTATAKLPDKGSGPTRPLSGGRRYMGIFLLARVGKRSFALSGRHLTASGIQLQLFDDFVGAAEECWRHGEAKRACGL
jgi:hypothetical protein